MLCRRVKDTVRVVAMWQKKHTSQMIERRDETDLELVFNIDKVSRIGVSFFSGKENRSGIGNYVAFLEGR